MFPGLLFLIIFYDNWYRFYHRQNKEEILTVFRGGYIYFTKKYFDEYSDFGKPRYSKDLP